MWTSLPERGPTMLITLTWIQWRQTILQTAGDQSKPTWNMPPATFTFGNMLFKMEHFRLYLWLFYRQSWSPHGASSAKWFIPPPIATSTLQSRGKRVEGKAEIYLKLSKPGDAVNKGRMDIVFVFKLKSCSYHLPHPPSCCSLSSLGKGLHEFDTITKEFFKTK